MKQDNFRKLQNKRSREQADKHDAGERCGPEYVLTRNGVKKGRSRTLKKFEVTNIG